MNSSQLAVVTAYQKGYRVRNNSVIGISKGKPLKLMTGTTGYFYFSIKISRKVLRVYIHRLVAYEKFGDKIFDCNIVVRHINGNQKDNSFENICIGSQSENMLDRKPEERLKHAIKASRANRKFTNEQINQIRKLHSDGLGYKFLMEKFKISSKSTLHYILNNEYVT